MPFIKKIEIQDGIIGFWEKSEGENEFASIFNLVKNDPEFIKINNEKRKQEFLATRALLTELSGRYIPIKYKSNGSPYLEDNSKHISISHSKNLIAVILHKKRVGIDVETTGRAVSRIAEKFLSEKELHFINSSENKEELLLLYWCSKEALFKCIGSDGILFRDQLLISPFELKNIGSFAACFLKDKTEKQFQMNYFHLKNNAVVWCVEYQK